MKSIIRSSLVLILMMFAGLSGCSSIQTVASSVTGAVGRITHPATPAASPSRPVLAGLDDYKTQVAQHVVQHNPEQTYTGTLPPLLPAIVVLEITVDAEGHMTRVAVQRSRDPDASQVALAAMQRSTPLPRPQQLAKATGQLTFSETFLFADSSRYQLRSLAGPQASE